MPTAVNVKLVKDTDTNLVEVIVSVRSNTRRGLWSEMRIDADDPKLDDKVAQAAGALCIHQITSYGDKHDPVEVSQKASEGLREIKIKAGRASRKIYSFGGGG